MTEVGTSRWQEKPLGELCDFRNGLWKGKKEPYIHVGVIRNTNFTKTGFLDDTKIAFLDVEVKQYTSRKLEFGDIILEKSGGGPKQAVGRVIPFDKKEGEYSFSNFTSVIRIKDNTLLDYTFLHRLLYFYYLSGATEPMQKHSTNIRNLQLKEYKLQPIPLPPLPEQKRIVAILDEAFAGISQAVANAEKNLANARELFESYLNNVFTQGSEDEGWILRRLGDLTEVQSGGTPLKSKLDYWKGEIPWYSSGELNAVYTNDPANQITESGLNNSNAKLFPAGSLLIGMYDTAALKMSIIDREAAFNQAIAGVKPNTDIVLIFIMYAINAAKPAILSQRRGVRQKNLSLGKIKDILIPLPNIAEQRSVVSKLFSLKEETQHIESIYQQKLTALTELKQSILQKAFSGELTSTTNTQIKIPHDA